MRAECLRGLRIREKGVGPVSTAPEKYGHWRTRERKGFYGNETDEHPL